MTGFPEKKLAPKTTASIDTKRNRPFKSLEDELEKQALRLVVHEASSFCFSYNSSQRLSRHTSINTLSYMKESESA